MAGLVGSSWLKTVRRRLEMVKLANEYRAEQPLADVCANCAVSANDPYVRERIGVWKGGFRSKVYIDADLRHQCEEFEKKYNVPPLPLNPGNWQVHLDLKEAFKTLCCRCAIEKGFTPPPAESIERKKKAVQESPEQLKDNDASLVPGDGSPTAKSDDDSSDGSGSNKSDIELDPPDMKRFPNLVDVQVSHTSAEMILFWAKQARKRLKIQRMRPPQDSDDEGGSDFDSGGE